MWVRRRLPGAGYGGRGEGCEVGECGRRKRVGCHCWVRWGRLRKGSEHQVKSCGTWRSTTWHSGSDLVECVNYRKSDICGRNFQNDANSGDIFGFCYEVEYFN